MNSIAKIEGRNYALDFVRFVMAFLVVVIHVPCFGSGYLMSVARCAIPFFYIVSGYFLWKDSEEDFFYACVRNAKKWLNLFIISALILSTATIVIKTIYTQPLAYFSWEQFFWLCLNGFYPSMEKIIFEDNPYGSFNVVWFLYAGIITFLLAKYLHRFIKRFFL